MSLEKLVADLDAFQASALEKLKSPELKVADLEQLRVDWLGKKGELTNSMKALGQLSPDERPKAGAKANEVRDLITQKLNERLAVVKESELSAQLAADKIDVSLPGRSKGAVYEHPVQIVQDELVKIFERCGFFPELGPEVENGFYNFDALNFPPNHPARTMQDTFFVKTDTGEEIVLRTHTSPVQVRTMLMQKPPIRMVCPGRVFRADYDATHSPMFHQIEGLLISENVHMGDLKGILAHMVQEFFGEGLAVRLRPSFFPFTEPSAEVDMECCFCKGKGCKTCKNSGWIEIGGCGMVDPEVLKAVNVDLEKYRGFAFGMGLERMAMLKFGIDDLRAFFESDHRFISQFARWRA